VRPGPRQRPVGFSEAPRGSDESLSRGVFRGRVHEVAGGVYTVERDDGERIEATLRGRLKHASGPEGQVVVGDRVRVEPTGDRWVVISVEPRTSALIRRGRGGRRGRVMAANLDRVFAVVSLRDPRGRPELVDRLLALAEAGGAEAILVVNKVELAESDGELDELVGPARAVGYTVLPVSARTGAGISRLREACATGPSAVSGPSGVGKSSLLNVLEPGLGLRVGALSRKTGTGKHTTVGSRLVRLPGGGLVADTPGFSDVGLWGVSEEDLEHCFPEIREVGEGCRFRSCTHRHEPGCAVLEAVEDGRVFVSRHGSYLTLRAEAEEAAT